MSYFQIERRNNVYVISPYVNKDLKVYQKDFLTNSRILDSTKTVKINNNLYNKDFIVAYLNYTKDYRDLNGKHISENDLITLGILPQPIVEVKSITLNIVQFLFDYSEQIVSKLLQACEIEAINSSMDLQYFFEDCWNKILICLIGVLHHNPLKVVELSTKLKSNIAEAYNACIDENTTLYVHEEDYLQPIYVSTYSMFTLFITGLFKFDNEETFISSSYLLKPGKINVH